METIVMVNRVAGPQRCQSFKTQVNEKHSKLVIYITLKENFILGVN